MAAIPDPTRLLLLGDVHGNTDHITYACEQALEQNCDAIVQLGDFGYWPHKADGEAFLDATIATLEKCNLQMYFVDGNHECATESARAVTRRGFTPVDELQVGDEVLSIDDNGTRCWQPIQEVIRRQHDGFVYRFQSRSAQFTVTPGHRVLYRPMSKNPLRRPLCEEYAQEFGGTSARLVISARNDQPDNLLRDDEIRLAAWCLTDAWQTAEGYWRFTQRASEFPRITELLDRLEVDYSRSLRERTITEIAGKKVTAHEHECVARVYAASSRSIPFAHNHLVDALWSMSQRQCSVFVDELVHCEGSIPTRATTSRVLYCSRESLRHELMALLVANGWRASETEYRPGHWRINLTQATEVIWTPKYGTKTILPYNGEVWCLRVPNGRFFMEEAGRIVLTGNCFSMLWGEHPITPEGFWRVWESPRLLYAPRGLRWKWGETKFLALGGAYSIDKEARLRWEGKAHRTLWWPEETITEGDIHRCLGTLNRKQARVDILLSHDCPLGVRIPGPLLSSIPESDQNRAALAQVVDAVRPKYLFHGHYHRTYTDTYKGKGFQTEVYGLAHDERWWESTLVFDLKENA